MSWSYSACRFGGKWYWYQGTENFSSKEIAILFSKFWTKIETNTIINFSFRVCIPLISSIRNIPNVMYLAPWPHSSQVISLISTLSLSVCLLPSLRLETYGLRRLLSLNCLYCVWPLGFRLIDCLVVQHAK